MSVNLALRLSIHRSGQDVCIKKATLHHWKVFVNMSGADADVQGISNMDLCNKQGLAFESL